LLATPLPAPALPLFSTSDNAHTNLVAAEPNSVVVSGFLDYLKVEKGLAPLTIAAYTTDVAQFAAFLEKRRRTLLNARRDDLREFIQQLFANAVDGRSVGRKLSFTERRRLHDEISTGDYTLREIIDLGSGMFRKAK